MADELEGNEIQDSEDAPATLTAEQAQEIKSWVGRVEKTGQGNTEMLKSISDKLEAMGNNEPAAPIFGEDPQEQLNKKTHEMILDGDVTGAFNLLKQIDDKAKALIDKQDNRQLTAALSAISDDPMMKNEVLAKQVADESARLVGEGINPANAVSHARATVENTALREMVQSGGSNVSLEMLGGGGGGEPPAVVDDKLPAAFEESYQQGKEKGLFKDRKDYTDNLSPAVKKQYGIK